jgi:hypothetical protein
VDSDWAIDQLQTYLRLCERVPLPPEEARPNKKTRVRGTTEELSNSENVVSAIAEVVLNERPRWVNETLVRRLIWELTDGDEVRTRLGVDDPAPSIEADSLHSWVWDAARPHWVSGNHDAAVWAAAVNVNSRLQRKIGRKDIGEGQLVRESFSTDNPKPLRPRLRLCDSSNQLLFQDMHIGASNLGQGLYSAVRNVLNRTDATEHSFREADSIESLAAFSLLARWIDRAKVVSVEPIETTLGD